MPTTVLALPNTYAGLDDLPAADVNALANSIEYAFAGYQSKSVAGSSDVTLTTAEASAAVLALSGAITANLNVIVPLWAGKRWAVYNNSTGAFTITVKGATGTGIVVRQGCVAWLYSDGTNVLRAGPDVEQDGDLSPTRIVDGNGNEVLIFTGVASSVNEITHTNAATGSGPLIEATGGDTNIDVTLRGKGAGGVQVSRSGGKLGFFGATLAARAAALTQTYATADRTLAAYTADPESSAYTGAADGEAKLADLNALRVAVENLRALTEDLAAFVNSVVDDLQAYGLEQ